MSAIGNEEIEATPETPRGKTSPFSALNFPPLLAPLIVVLTGMMYLCGYAWSGVQNEKFGLSAALFQESFQMTLARGYLPLLLLMLMLLPLAVSIWVIRKTNAHRASTKPSEKPRPARRLGPRMRTLLQAYAMLFGGVAVLSGAVFAGAAWGWYVSRLIVSSVDSGCAERCFVYRVGEREYLGRLVWQDTSLTAVYTKGGVAVFKSNELLGVRAAVPAAAQLAPGANQPVVPSGMSSPH